jgi:hypothetical protein
MLVILNCLLHNQYDGWTLPKPYFLVCCKNIYLRIFLKKPTLLDKNCRMYSFGLLPGVWI